MFFDDRSKTSTDLADSSKFRTLECTTFRDYIDDTDNITCINRTDWIGLFGHKVYSCVVVSSRSTESTEIRMAWSVPYTTDTSEHSLFLSCLLISFRSASSKRPLVTFTWCSLCMGNYFLKVEVVSRAIQYSTGAVRFFQWEMPLDERETS